MVRIERTTSPLPRECSATELHGLGMRFLANLFLRLAAVPGTDVWQALRAAEAGAGEGNRTLVVSLEGFCSTIELHPPQISPLRRSARPLMPQVSWWRGKDSNLRRLSQQIYSLPPLTAREPLRGNRALSGNCTLLSNVIKPVFARDTALKRRTPRAETIAFYRQHRSWRRNRYSALLLDQERPRKRTGIMTAARPSRLTIDIRRHRHMFTLRCDGEIPHEKTRQDQNVVA
jgi:hypothetical protein